jgi:V/A-type H+-transporting ATPase subunit B
MAAILGESGLAPADRRAFAFAGRFEREFVGQSRRRRTIAETIESGWKLLETLPREDCLRISDAVWQGRERLRLGTDPA